MDEKQNEHGVFNLMVQSTPHVREVIITHEMKGLGSDGDPVRRVLHVWTMKGELLAIGKDPWDENEEEL